MILGSVVPVLRRLRPPHAVLVPAVRAARTALVERNPAAAEQRIRSFLRLEREFPLEELEHVSVTSDSFPPGR